MEIQLVIGPNNSGKSLYAESLAVEISENRFPLIYLATMVPQTEDNYRRIEKHRLQRREKGFHTVEADWDIDQLDLPENAVILLEDCSNLLANGIFAHGCSAEDALAAVCTLASHCRALIAVSIDGLSADGYDSETAAYINGLNWLNEQLAARAARVIYPKKI